MSFIKNLNNDIEGNEVVPGNTKPTLEHALRVKQQQDAEKKRIEACIEAKICPECGSPLREQKIKFSFGGGKHRKICSNIPEHYNEIHYHYSYSGYY